MAILKCRFCEREYPEGYRFCPDCGAQLVERGTLVASMSPARPAWPLDLAAYRALLSLDLPFAPPLPASAREAPQLVEDLLAELLTDTELIASLRERTSDERLSRRALLQALLTVRAPKPFLTPGFHAKVDRLLQFEAQARPTIAAQDLPTVFSVFESTKLASARSCVLWRGDITTLRIDAIVNAANDALLGCFEPFHACIDNVIHTAAGPRLREDCWRIMARQGTREPVGDAKITRGYHLPAAFVLHTVGPFHQGNALEPSHESQAALASSYRTCLHLAAQLPAIKSLAFPCISTGIFGYPPAAAARVAVQTVDQWLVEHPGALDRVVFNVFTDQDLAIYQELLAGTI